MNFYNQLKSSGAGKGNEVHHIIEKRFTNDSTRALFESVGIRGLNFDPVMRSRNGTPLENIYQMRFAGLPEEAIGLVWKGVITMKKTRIQVPKLRMTVFALACLLLGGALLSGCSAGTEKPPLPAALNYMPLSCLESKLSTYFPLGMSKTEVEDALKVHDEWLHLRGICDHGIYVDDKGNVLRYSEGAENEIGVSSYEADLIDAPAVACIAHFAFDENEELIDVRVRRVWTMY